MKSFNEFAISARGAEQQEAGKHLKNNAKVFGAREWAKSSVNCLKGCPHDCRYCYAKSMALRFKRLAKVEDWEKQTVIQKAVEKRYALRNGTVMFPSSHDITPNNLDVCCTVLEKLLKAGNQVLVVSKPHIECITRICNDSGDYKDNMLFRFTIGALNNEILSFWEPNAPPYEERKESLKYAHDAGFRTSVSAEPMLDSEHIEDLVNDLSPFVTDSIWIGKMNHLGRIIAMNNGNMAAEGERIKAGQTDEKIQQIYESLKDHPLVKWKESIKKVVGLELAEEPGLDV
jgi:DNA repair photolyase